MMNSEQTATHVTYKQSVQGSILWNQGHVSILQYCLILVYC